HAAFHFAPESIGANRAHFAKRGRVDDYAALSGNGTARQGSPCTAYAYWYVQVLCIMHDGRQLFGVGRNDHGVRTKCLVPEAVSIIAGKLCGRGKHPSSGNVFSKERFESVSVHDIP